VEPEVVTECKFRDERGKGGMLNTLMGAVFLIRSFGRRTWCKRHDLSAPGGLGCEAHYGKEEAKNRKSGKTESLLGGGISSRGKKSKNQKTGLGIGFISVWEKGVFGERLKTTKGLLY